MPGALLETREELVSAVRSDRRFGAWTVREEGPGWAEMIRAPVVLVLAWPELWRDRAQLEPHLTRARSGNYILVLVGTAAELAEGRVDELADGAVRLTPLVVPLPAGALALALGSLADSNRLVLERAEYTLSLHDALPIYRKSVV